MKKNKSKNAPCMEGSSQDCCPHFLECGGCKYQKMTYEEQLAVKEKELRELYVPVVGEETYGEVWEGIRVSPVQEGYRNKMEFSFGDEYLDGPLALGMHKRGSHYDIVSVRNCRIAHPDMIRVLNATLIFFASRDIKHYNRNRHTGYMRHLLVRRAYHTGDILVDLVTTGNGRDIDREHLLTCEKSPMVMSDNEEHALLKDWKDAVLGCGCEGSFAGILHTRNDRIADVVEDGGTDVLYGIPEFSEDLLGLTFRISPFSFFQTNSGAAEVLYDTVREYLSDIAPKLLYDLYCGTGTISMLLSPVAGKVVGVELIPEAVEVAKQSAKDNDISNCDFIAGDVLKVLDNLSAPPDAIILDPPRDGVNPKALRKILSYGAKTIVYIACRPSSLGRDYEVFRHFGYEMSRLSATDMYPFTRHIEVAALLVKVD